MLRLILLFGTLVLGSLFMFHRPEGEIGFMFSDVVLHADTYVYFVMEHIIKILLVLVIWELDKANRVAISTLLALEFMDLVDFVLTYNSVWFKFISMNTIAPIIFGLAIVYERKRRT
jgi:hypothetical protein